MRKTGWFFFLTLIVWAGCTRAVPEVRIVVSGETIAERVEAPEGYVWVTEELGSFGAFLQNLEVEPAGTQILDHKNNPILNQSGHVAIIKKAIGNKDLQQCADAVIRLRADYLWQEDRQDYGTPHSLDQF